MKRNILLILITICMSHTIFSSDNFWNAYGLKNVKAPTVKTLEKRQNEIIEELTSMEKTLDNNFFSITQKVYAAFLSFISKAPKDEGLSYFHTSIKDIYGEKAYEEIKEEKSIKQLLKRLNEWPEIFNNGSKDQDFRPDFFKQQKENGEEIMCNEEFQAISFIVDATKNMIAHESRSSLVGNGAYAGIKTFKKDQHKNYKRYIHYSNKDISTYNKGELIYTCAHEKIHHAKNHTLTGAGIFFNTGKKSNLSFFTDYMKAAETQATFSPGLRAAQILCSDKNLDEITKQTAKILVSHPYEDVKIKSIVVLAIQHLYARSVLQNIPKLANYLHGTDNVQNTQIYPTYFERYLFSKKLTQMVKEFESCEQLKQLILKDQSYSK